MPTTEEELYASYFEDRNGSKSAEKEKDGYLAKRKAEIHCKYLLPKLLSMAKENPHLKILDIGCGSGDITIDFAEMCPEAWVIGVDLSGAVLETARMYAMRRSVKNVEFVQKSIYDMPEEWSGEFDIVHTHQVVAHLKDRVAGIREMVRITKRGGVICMREGDLCTARFYPDYPVLEECFKVIMAVHQANGGATDAGRQLKLWAIKAGLGQQHILATYSVSRYDTTEGRRAYGGHWPGRCAQGLFASRAMELGISSERLDEYALAWKEWIEDEDGMFAMMNGELIAEIT